LVIARHPNYELIQREAAEKAAREEAERLRQEKERKEYESKELERTIREKLAREVDEEDKRRSAREQEEREAWERTTRERLEREAAERERLRSEQVDVRGYAVKETADPDAAESPIPEKVERQIDRKIEKPSILPKSFAWVGTQRFFWGAGIITLIISLFAMSPVFPFLTAEPSATITSTVTPSLTPTPNRIKTLLAITRTITPTPTITLSPTPTLTPTAIPTDSFLLQQNFEDNKANGWTRYDVKMTIDQEPNGNHYLSLSGPSGFPRIFYENNSSHWTDYAFESRIKFVEGRDIGINLGVHVANNSFYKLLVYNKAVNFYHQDASGGYREYGTWFPKEFVLNQWYTFQIEIRGVQAAIYIDNVLVDNYLLDNPLLNSYGGICYIIAGGQKIYVDDIKVWKLE